MAKRNMFSSRNPILNEKLIERQGDISVSEYEGDVMTISGAINKTGILFLILLFVSLISYTMASPFLMWGGMIGGLIAAVFAVYKPHTSAIAAPVYAAFEGLFIGSISAYFAQAFDGIVINAIMLTFASFAIMLLIYKFEIIKLTDKLKSGIVMATGSIFILYLASWIFGMFGIHLPFLHQGGWLSIGFSVVVIAVASLNLLLDFDLFEKTEQRQAPQYMEWFCAMSLLITLVWLYVEFLRLLSYLED